MPAILLTIGRFLLVFGRSVGPWLLGLAPWLKSFGQWLTGQAWWQFLTFQASNYMLNALVKSAMVIACLVAYGIFLLVFWTWVSGASFHEILGTNPLSGAPAAAMYLATHAFPFKFLFGSFIAYMQWRLSVIAAAITLSRVIKGLPGV